MGRDLSLTAGTDAAWLHVELTAAEIRTATLRALAELWVEDPDVVTGVLDRLADAHQAGPVEAWDAAMEDAESDLRMAPAVVVMDATRALQLADELRDAAKQTLGARVRAIPVPTQADRSAAA